MLKSASQADSMTTSPARSGFYASAIEERSDNDQIGISEVPTMAPETPNKASTLTSGCRARSLLSLALMREKFAPDLLDSVRTSDENPSFGQQNSAPQLFPEMSSSPPINIPNTTVSE